MDFVRAGEALMRSSQPLFPFLAPSVYRAAGSRKITQHLRQHRALSANPVRRAEDDPFGADLDDALAQDKRNSTKDDDFSAILNETLDQDKRNPTAPIGRTSRYASPRGQLLNRTTASPSASVAAARDRNSISDIISDMGGGSSTRRSAPSRASNTKYGDAFEIETMLDVGNAINPNLPPSRPLAPPTPHVKLNSTVGRTIDVNEGRGMDVGRAFRTLDMRCAQNNVRKDFQRQRYHERPGLKRKRLKSERWRKRFKDSFRETIKLVQGLKKQGW